MQKTKSLLSVVLAIVLIICMVPLGTFTLTVNAATEYTSGYYTYTLSNNQATITKVDSAISGSVTIPSTLDGYTVVGIDGYVFQNIAKKGCKLGPIMIKCTMYK